METTLEKFKDFMGENKMFCTQVDVLFTVELKLMGECRILQELSEYKFVMNDSRSMKKMIHILEVVGKDRTNFSFPCMHLARYYERKRMKFLSIDDLPTRWRFQRYPVWKFEFWEIESDSSGSKWVLELMVKVPSLHLVHILSKAEA
eukprot:snap_masked-scaffold_31-processed-gene-3.32-mRNA-1 protein AED:1.00 eAED:1.00 QI:0/0/0/0/1/1/2/0/146